MTVAELFDEACNRHEAIATLIPDNETWLSYAAEAEALGIHFPSRRPLLNYFEIVKILFPVGIILEEDHEITYEEHLEGLEAYRVLTYEPLDTTPFLSDDISSILNI